jgi:hypothetical protein
MLEFDNFTRIIFLHSADEELKLKKFMHILMYFV